MSHYSCLFLECALAILLVAAALTVPQIGEVGFAWVESTLTRVARSPTRSVLVVMLVALAGRAALLPLFPPPAPSIHDEFSYLLAAETYASGRLANTPSPMWPHFETIHILQQPTYMSMYPPAQGLFLALGKKLIGHAWFGAWFAFILMTGAICWMLQGWLPASWALAGGLLVIARWGLFSYWVNSYWGGAVPGLGGALVIGSLPRLVRRGRSRDASWLAAGLALLANSRPYEGLIVSATAITTCFVWTFMHRRSRRLLRLKVVAPIIVVLSFCAVGMLYYNARVTGSALLLPYRADRQQYARAPLFLLQGLRPAPSYRAASLRHVYQAEVELYRRGRRLGGLPEMLRKIKNLWLFFVGPLLTIPFLALLVQPAPKRDTRKKFFLLVVGALTIGLLAEVWFYPHYAAPAMAAIIALLLLGLRRLRTWIWRNKRSGLFLARAVPVACLLMGFIPLAAARFKITLSYWPNQWYGGSPSVVRPASLTAGLTHALIIVRYGPTHEVGEEWVYNGADIDRSPVVWARETDPAQDAELICYFKDRTVWVLEPDKHRWVLRPYSPSKP